MSRRHTIAAAMAACSLVACEPADPTVKETPLVVVSDEEGFGPPAADGDLVTIRYRLTTPEGRLVLEDDEYSFILGTNSVIEGIEKTVLGMRRRGTRVTDCPPHKHWGRPGYGNGAVPPDTHLFIEVELLDKE